MAYEYHVVISAHDPGVKCFKLRLRVSGPARNIGTYRLCLNGPEGFLEE